MKEKRKTIFSNIYLALIFLFLYAPVFTLIFFSFSDSRSRNHFGAFTLKWYQSLLSNTELMGAVYNTLIIAVISALISVILGTLASIGMYFMPKWTRKIVMNITYLPILNPDIVTGISLMLLFIFCKIDMGYMTLILAHITFCTPYVILSVTPKLKKMGHTLFEAAEDLGASTVYTVKKIIIPQIIPEILNGALLAFTLSLDDFIISFFNNGYVETLSISVYSQTKQGVNPEINALSTLMFVILISLLIAINSRKKIKSFG